jgi:hypothetical protein
MSILMRGVIAAALAWTLLIPSVAMAVECNTSGPTEEDYRKAYAIVLEQEKDSGTSMTPALRKALAIEFADCANIKARQACRAGVSLLSPHPEMLPVIKHVLELTLDLCWMTAVTANLNAFGQGPP